MHARPPVDRWLVLVVGAPALLHLACLTQYGWFRDELYYVACGMRPALGYVDHPPLVAWIAALVRATFGDSLVALRLVAVASGVATACVTASIARRLGGDVWATRLAAMAVGWSPVHLYVFHVFSMNAFEPLLWTLVVRLAIEVLDAPRADRSVGVGMMLGLALGLATLTKHAGAVLGMAVALGVVATGARAKLREPALWLAAAVAIAIAMPHVVWQAQAGWPTAEFARNASSTKNTVLSLGAMLSAQALLVHPLNLPIWAFGVVWLLRNAVHRWLGVTYLALLVALLLTQSKPYYIASIYPALLAAGAVAMRACSLRAPRALTAPLAVVWAMGGVAVIPFGMPILPVERFLALQRAVGVSAPKTERDPTGELPQIYADMFGWPELTAEVKRTLDALPESERRRAHVLAGNYGEAAALEVLGAPLGLPAVTSGHNAYFTWGTQLRSDSVVVVAAKSLSDERLARWFDQVEQVGTVQCSRCLPALRGAPIRVARGLRLPPDALLRDLRTFR